MDPVIRAKDYLLDNVGHMTYPGHASFDPVGNRWLVPIYCQTKRGAVVVGDVELDHEGRLVSAPSREEMLTRLATTAASAS